MIGVRDPYRKAVVVPKPAARGSLRAQGIIDWARNAWRRTRCRGRSSSSPSCPRLRPARSSGARCRRKRTAARPVREPKGPRNPLRRLGMRRVAGQGQKGNARLNRYSADRTAASSTQYRLLNRVCKATRTDRPSDIRPMGSQAIVVCPRNVLALRCPELGRHPGSRRIHRHAAEAAATGHSM